MDWLDLTSPGRFRAYMIEPNRLNNVLDELSGVKWDACSIEAGYYTDTRTTAKLVVHDTNWDMRSWIRLVYETEETTFEVGTYIVTSDPADYRNGTWSYSLSLNSVLWGLAQEKSALPWTIGKGTKASTALARLFGWCQCAYNIAGMQEYVATAAGTLERGKSMLDWLFAIANYSGNRVDVDGHGTVFVSRRVAPQNITQGWKLDLSDPRGLVVDGIHRESDWLTTPGRVIVHHQKQDGTNIVAYADSEGHASFANRGYLTTEFQSVSDMSPETYARASAIAKQKLTELGTAQIEWTVTVPMIPIWEGSGVSLLPHDVAYTGVRNCFVKSLSLSDLHLNRPTMKLTLKECASGDKGDE